MSDTFEVPVHELVTVKAQSAYHARNHVRLVVQGDPFDDPITLKTSEPYDYARDLAHYIEKIYSSVPNKSKFFSCLPSIILDFDRGRDPQKLAEEINEHG